MKGIEIDKNREVAVVIYRDENVLACLQQELLEAAVNALKNGGFNAESTGSLTYFTNEDYAGLRLCYGTCMGLHVDYQAEIAANAKLQAVVDSYKRDAIQAQLIELDAQKQALEKQLEQLQ